jgi:hypothetical protein
VIHGAIDKDLIIPNYIETFATKILKACSDKPREPSESPVSIISLNWDMLLDKALFSLLKKQNGHLDYGCTCYGIHPGHHMVSRDTAYYSRKQFSVRLLKPHGSLNWTVCPRCQRLFVNQEEPEAAYALAEKRKCRICKVNKVNHALLLPTFLKDLQRLHFQQIWHEVAEEIATASRLVFIGYSFPLADFDFRGILTRHAANAEVDVVLYRNDESIGDYQINDMKYESDVNAYRAFFGDKVNSSYDAGVEQWIEDKMDRVLP